MSNIIIAASILASDFGNFYSESKSVLEAGSDWLHLDVMDGNFVPPITFGDGVVSALRKHLPSSVLDVHLMIEKPERHVEAFAKAGANYISFHIEATNHAHRVIQQIRSLGVNPGIAINPSTPVSAIEELLGDVDLVVVMTVNPGWGGQKLVPKTLDKVSRLKEICPSHVKIEVDGGISPATSRQAINAGAEVLVAGSAVFGSGNYAEAISAIRGG